MKEIKRDDYLKKFVDAIDVPLIKVITGIRRCGKSYLLNNIFYNYLLENKITDENHIISLQLDKEENIDYRDPLALNKFVKSNIKDKKMYFVLLDEIQLVPNFEAVLNGFLYEKNINVYVTGSNSKFLSSDIITEFRGRSLEIKIYPLSFSEFVSNYSDYNKAWRDYLLYGGLPLVLTMKSDEEKANYLKDLIKYTYEKDIIERYDIKRFDILDNILDLLASSVGSLTNPQKIYDTFVSNGVKELSLNTINSYLKYISDSFIVSNVKRYNIKGRKYINTPLKYYYTDIGLRNAKINFRQLEENHLMENIIYNELVIRGYSVDVGVVPISENNSRKQLEIDFICNFLDKKYYVQSAFNMDTDEKAYQEKRPLISTNDNFKKIIIVRNLLKHYTSDDGILIIGIEEFLLNKDSLNF